jgi:hypothetical protein
LRSTQCAATKKKLELCCSTARISDAVDAHWLLARN